MFQRLGKLFDWLGRNELAVLLAILIVVLGVWAALCWLVQRKLQQRGVVEARD